MGVALATSMFLGFYYASKLEPGTSEEDVVNQISTDPAFENDLSVLKGTFNSQQVSAFEQGFLGAMGGLMGLVGDVSKTIAFSVMRSGLANTCTRFLGIGNHAVDAKAKTSNQRLAFNMLLDISISAVMTVVFYYPYKGTPSNMVSAQDIVNRLNEDSAFQKAMSLLKTAGLNTTQVTNFKAALFDAIKSASPYLIKGAELIESNLLTNFYISTGHYLTTKTASSVIGYLADNSNGKAPKGGAFFKNHEYKIKGLSATVIYGTTLALLLSKAGNKGSINLIDGEEFSKVIGSNPDFIAHIKAMGGIPATQQKAIGDCILVASKHVAGAINLSANDITPLIYVSGFAITADQYVTELFHTWHKHREAIQNGANPSLTGTLPTTAMNYNPLYEEGFNKNPLYEAKSITDETTPLVQSNRNRRCTII